MRTIANHGLIFILLLLLLAACSQPKTTSTPTTSPTHLPLLPHPQLLYRQVPTQNLSLIRQQTCQPAPLRCFPPLSLEANQTLYRFQEESSYGTLQITA